MKTLRNIAIGMAIATLMLVMLATSASALTANLFTDQEDYGWDYTVKDQNGNNLTGNGVAGSSCLVQTIRDNSKNGISPPDPSDPSKCSDPDDEVLDVMYIGQGGYAPDTGEFYDVYGGATELFEGQRLYCRAWNGFSLEEATHYGDSHYGVDMLLGTHDYNMVSGGIDGGIPPTAYLWWTNESKPTPLYTISGYIFNKDGNPQPDPEVNVTNLNNSKEWPADYIGTDGFYNLTLNVGEDVNATEILQTVACKHYTTNESYCNVSNHEPQNIPGEDTNVNLTLNHYCLNYEYEPGYPYKTWEQTNWSGPAVMQMMVKHYRPLEPTQSYLNATGIEHNQACNANLSYVDPKGMGWTLNNILHNTSSYGGGKFANYGIGSYTTVEKALWYICYWHYLGPGAAPTYGDYTNWMAIRGIHTSENPKWMAQGTYDIYGFWINDPYNATLEGPGGIGENTYKSVDQWTGTYHKNLTGVRDGDIYKNRYVAICEPPEQEPGEVRLVHSKARFSGTIIAAATDEELTVDVGGVPLNQLICNRKLIREKENKVVQAAIDGVNEQLAPYDRGFKKTFAGTVAGKPMPVTSDAGDYYLVPFGIESDGNSVLAVVIVDSDGGKFKEASWVNEPVKYLSVTPQEALKIVYKEMKGKSTIKVMKKDKATGKLKKADVIDENIDTLGDITLDETEKQNRKAYLELVYKGESPYYPVWKITIGDSVFFVDQSGTLTCNEPVKSIEPVLQTVE